MTQSQVAANPVHQEERKANKQAQKKQPHEKHTNLLSLSPSELFAMLKGLKNTRTRGGGDGCKSSFTVDYDLGSDAILKTEININGSLFSRSTEAKT